MVLKEEFEKSFISKESACFDFESFDEILWAAKNESKCDEIFRVTGQVLGCVSDVRFNVLKFVMSRHHKYFRSHTTPIPAAGP